MIGLIYSLIVLAYVTYLYILALSKKNIKYKERNVPFMVIIPCYNEKYQYLKNCADSLINARGTKQVILVDNNSTHEDTLRALNEYRRDPRITVLKEKRQGKRFAHARGLSHAWYDLIVFVDSDTVVLEDSLIELIKPFQNKKIGASCGNIGIANRQESLLTKCLDSMYWNSFEFYRRATTSIGYIQVCSGALSAYRKWHLQMLENEYLNQKFLGRPCSISDDRFITLRIQLRFGKKTAYQSTAVGLTYSPATISGFWKQIVRWRLGFLRESLLIWKEPKKYQMVVY